MARVLPRMMPSDHINLKPEAVHTSDQPDMIKLWSCRLQHAARILLWIAPESLTRAVHRKRSQSWQHLYMTSGNGRHGTHKMPHFPVCYCRGLLYRTLAGCCGIYNLNAVLVGEAGWALCQ
ncbi:hypothetical protein Bbelb_150410 [Branchiostoma belcheri]|nr:hypothetical protein Bbelb_150410 [Branchiostoma belcheri]